MKRRKILIRCGIVATIGLLAVAAFHIWAAAEDRKYAAYLNSGASINRFLKAYGQEVTAAVESGDASGLMDFYAEDFRAPGRGYWTFSDPGEVGGVLHSEFRVEGRDDYDRDDRLTELTHYISELRSVERIACKINLAEKISPGDLAVITVKYVLDGIDREGRVMQDRYFFRWTLNATDTGHGWKVANEELLVDPEVTNTRVTQVRPGFESLDLAAAGIEYVHQRDPNTNPDSPSVSLKFAVIQHSFGGVSTADYDGDGRADILFLDGVRSCLYRQVDSGQQLQFEDVTDEAGLGELNRATSAAFADFDNDGDKDLFVARYAAPNRLFINQGDGTFVDHAESMNLDFDGPCISTTLLDYDRDGNLDIYVAVNGDAVNEIPRIPFYARNGLPNRLFRNLGEDNGFEDVTESANVGGNGWSLATCTFDLNSDGWTDLAVANDFGRKEIFRNNGDGTFTEIAKAAGTLDFSGGMGVASGDINGDGQIDLYTSNIYSNQRWLGEQAAIMKYTRNTLRSQWLIRDFGEFVSLNLLVNGDWKSLGRQAGEGNSLFVNNGDGIFTEARDSCTNRAGWGWSVALFDADNDTDLDIYAANGWISGEKKDDL